MAKNDLFAKQVSDFAINFDNASEDTVKATAIATWEAVIKSSPVDEGRFRANWFASGGAPSDKVTDSNDKSGANAISNATSSVLKQSDWSSFYLSNNLPYAEVIEFGGYNDGPNTASGYSKQSPQGVVRINIEKSKQLLEGEANKRLKKL